MSKSKSKKKKGKSKDKSFDNQRIRYSKKKLENRTEFLNYILRYWFHVLTATEKLAVLFIYDRTYGWNKTKERITVNQFTQGLFSLNKETGYVDSWAAPFTKDRTNAQKVVKGLVEKGAVERIEIKTNKGKQFEYSLNEEWELPEIKIPKKIKEKISKQIDQLEEDN